MDRRSFLARGALAALASSLLPKWIKGAEVAPSVPQVEPTGWYVLNRDGSYSSFTTGATVLDAQRIRVEWGSGITSIPEL